MDSWEVLLTHDGVNWTSTTDPLARLPTKNQILHLLLQFVSQDSDHDLPIHNQNSPYQGFWRSEVHFRRLRISIDSQSVVCVHSVGFGSSLLVLVVFLTDSCGSTLFILLCIYHLCKRYMISGHV